MKTLTLLLAASLVLASCKKTNTTCVFKSDCSTAIESPYAVKKFITKKELQEKDSKLFKYSFNHLL